MIDSTGPSSYAQLSQYSARIANTLLLPDEHDLGEKRIAYLIAPSFEYVAAQWGFWRAGGVAVPLAVQHPTPELAYVFDDAQVSTVIVQPQLKDRVHEIAAARSIRLVTTDEISVVSSRVEFPELDPSRRAMILYTSGSTGRPKGVVTTHANILAQIDALVVAWEWQRDDHVLNVLPMHHVHGIINILSCALRVGATCEFQRFDEVGVWERFARGDLTLFMGVPTIYAKLIASWHNASADQQSQWSRGAKTMRLMVSGSAALPVSTLEQWEQITGQRLLERYGMTEIGMALSNPLHGKRRAGFVGRSLPGVEVRRVDAANNLVEDATPGEIEVRGANVFHEYWNRPRERACAQPRSHRPARDRRGQRRRLFPHRCGV